MNLRRLVGSQSDDFEWELNVALNEDSDGEGDNSDGENEVVIEAQCSEKRERVLQHIWTNETMLKIVK